MKINAKTKKALAKAKVEFVARKNGKSNGKLAKGNGKGKMVAANRATSATPVKVGSLIVIGTRGTAFPLAWPDGQPTDGTPLAPFVKTKFRSLGLSSEDLCALHARGKVTGLTDVDSCSWISERGATFRCYRLSAALAKKAVKPLKVSATDAGTGKTAVMTVYVPGDYKDSQGFPIRLATSGNRAGRVELTTVSDGRNKEMAGFRYSLKPLVK